MQGAAGAWLIDLYLISTSNHNAQHQQQTQIKIDLYLISTSNHNNDSVRASLSPLTYISFLHQTTTVEHSLLLRDVLTYISFLHQTTTTYAHQRTAYN